MAIARYIARENDLAGKTNWDAAVADMYIDCTKDLIMSKGQKVLCTTGSPRYMVHANYVHFLQRWNAISECMPFYYEKDEAKKQEIKEKLANETLPEFAANFEKSLKGRVFRSVRSQPLFLSRLMLGQFVINLS